MPVNRPQVAAVLRRAREGVRPEDVGLAAGSRRRVPGLRREELALLAGISVDYVVRLEQGRGPQPSSQVLGALARALRLDVDARDELFRLAGTPPPEAGTIDVHVRPSVLRLIDRFTDLPAFVQSAKGDVLAWNAMSAALQGDWSGLRPDQRNLARLRFLHDPGGEVMTPVGGTPEERAAIARQSVANLRRAAARYPRDPDLQRLLRDLRSGSPEFAALWDDTAAGAWRSHRKTLLHPAVGPLTLECDTLHVPDSDQLLVVYSAAPGTPEADALALLRVLGTQQLRERAGASGGGARPT